MKPSFQQGPFYRGPVVHTQWSGFREAKATQGFNNKSNYVTGPQPSTGLKCLLWVHDAHGGGPSGFVLWRSLRCFWDKESPTGVIRLTIWKEDTFVREKCGSRTEKWRKGRVRTQKKSKERHTSPELEVENKKWPKEEPSPILCFQPVMHENFLHNGFKPTCTTHTHSPWALERNLWERIYLYVPDSALLHSLAMLILLPSLSHFPVVGLRKSTGHIAKV